MSIKLDKVHSIYLRNVFAKCFLGYKSARRRTTALLFGVVFTAETSIIYRRIQVEGEMVRRMGYISNLPMSIAKDSNSLLSQLYI